MDTGTISILLSAGSLLLGFIAAYGQIKRFVVRSLTRGGEALSKLNAREAERAATFLAFPSAFVAFVVKRVSLVLILIFLSVALPDLINNMAPGIPDSIISVARLIPPALAGLLFGGLTSASSDVLKEARRARASAG